MRVPSGDQLGSNSGPRFVVRRRTFVPSAAATYTSPPSRENVIRPERLATVIGGDPGRAEGAVGGLVGDDAGRPAGLPAEHAAQAMAVAMARAGRLRSFMPHLHPEAPVGSECQAGGLARLPAGAHEW